ncbi:hypothetical protein [Kutzneria chonburiensis]|uniref:Uncharacterized protein n=1 Tax=Kutzneria chonburiensis TaxID=1483604 RepID=A0ABV6MRY0_9PSEU|nr:hypothetical protein [Kutzneria chonburiensis]
MRAGRPEQRFAWEWRQLRERVRRPTSRRLAQQAHYSVPTLADAADFAA